MSSKPKDSLWQLILAFLQAIGLVKRPKPYPPPPAPTPIPPSPPANQDAPDFLGFWCERGYYFVKGERTSLLTTYFTSSCAPNLGEYGINDNETGPYDVSLGIYKDGSLVSECVYRDNGAGCQREFRPSGEFYWYPDNVRPWNMAAPRRVSSPLGCDPIPVPPKPTPPVHLTPYVIAVIVRNRFGRTKCRTIQTYVDTTPSCETDV